MLRLLVTLDLNPGREGMRENTIVEVALGYSVAILFLLLALKASNPEEE